jgi:hypothetical protein
MTDKKGPPCRMYTSHPPLATVTQGTATRRTLHRLLFMSAFARSPESYAAWQQLKRNVALRPHDDEQRAQRERGTQELHRLLSRMSSSLVSPFLFIIVVHSPHPISYLGTKTELEASPTPERLERFCRVSEEVTRLAEQSFLRTLERDRYQDMCIADLQAGIENYRRMFDEHLRLVDFVHQQHVLALQKQIELEKRKRVFAENELRKATTTHHQATHRGP